MKKLQITFRIVHSINISPTFIRLRYNSCRYKKGYVVGMVRWCLQHSQLQVAVQCNAGMWVFWIAYNITQIPSFTTLIWEPKVYYLKQAVIFCDGVVAMNQSAVNNDTCLVPCALCMTL